MGRVYSRTRAKYNSAKKNNKTGSRRQLRRQQKEEWKRYSPFEDSQEYHESFAQ